LKNAKEFPSPQEYGEIKNYSTLSKSKGKSFGISYEHFKKMYIPGFNQQDVLTSAEIPVT
jgi:hypothetical protein